MVASLLKTVAYKCFLPLALLIAGCVRPSLLSALYVGVGLLCPLLPSTRSTDIKIPVSVRATLLFLLVLTFCTCIGQVAYQVLVRDVTETSYIASCKNESMTQLLRMIGFEKLDTTMLSTHVVAVLSVLPEPMALVATLITTVIVLLLRHPIKRTSSTENTAVQVVRDSGSVASPRAVTNWLSSALGDTLRRASNMLIMILIGATSCIQPSVLSAAYFLLFLFILTWYAMHKSIQHEGLNRIKQLIILYSGFHFFLTFIYQISEVQLHLPSAELAARLLGLTSILRNDCQSWYIYPHLEWPYYVNPIAVLVLFQATIWQYSFTKYGTHQYTRIETSDDGGSSVHEERRLTKRSVFGAINGNGYRTSRESLRDPQSFEEYGMEELRRTTTEKAPPVEVKLSTALAAWDYDSFADALSS